MDDKINIIVERDGEFHKFKFGKFSCETCSIKMAPRSSRKVDVCDICLALDDGNFEKVATD